MKYWGTTADFIANGGKGVPVGTVLDLQGDIVAGDNLGVRWKKTATTGTASTRVNISTFNDALGYQWKLVCGEKTEIETFDDLQTLQPEDGDFPKKFICVERANAEYLLQPSGYVALAGDVTFANGRVAALQIDGYASVLNFGVYDGVDVSPLIAVAANSGRAARYLLRGDYTAITKAAITKSNVTLDFSGSTFDCTELEYDKTTVGGGAFVEFSGVNNGVAAVSDSSILSGQQSISVSDTSGINVGDIARVYSLEVVYSNSSVSSYQTHITTVTAIVGSTVYLEHPFILEWDTSTYPASIEYTTPINNCFVVGGNIIGGGATESPLDNNRGQSGIFFYGVKDFGVKDTSFNNLYAAAAITERSINGEFDHISMIGRGYDVTPVEGINSSWYGVYAIRSRNVTTTRSSGVRMRHVCDAAQSIDVTQFNNTSTDSHKAAFGSHESVYNLNVSLNSVNGGEAGVAFRAYSGKISQNNITAYTPITMSNMLSGERGGSLIISGNTQLKSTGSNGTIYVTAAFNSLQIKNNNIESSTTDGVKLDSYDLENINISGNDFIGVAGVSHVLPTLGTFSNITIKNNSFNGYTGRAVQLKGSSLPSLPAENIKISGNDFTPSGDGINAILLRGDGYFGDNVYVTDNNQFGSDRAMLSITTYSRFSSLPVVEQNGQSLKTDQVDRVVNYALSGSVPSGSTVLKGSIITRSTQQSGQPYKWVALTGGTNATFSGITCDTTAGSSSITIYGNSTTGVIRGSYITIAGAGSGGLDLSARVDSISDDMVTAEIDSTASTTTSAAAVSATSATFGVVSTVS